MVFKCCSGARVRVMTFEELQELQRGLQACNATPANLSALAKVKGLLGE